MRAKISLIAIVAIGMLAGCATIKHGTKQKLPITSQPSGAKVYVDGAYVGVTPTEVKLARSKNHKVGLTMVGHEMGLIDLTPEFSANAWYNVALMPGVFAGFLVDSITGGLYDFGVDGIEHHMVKQVTIPQVQQ
jgi:hypothetical protein